MRARALLWLLPPALLFVPAFPEPPLHSGAYVQNVTPTSAIVAKIESVPRALSVRLLAGGDEMRVTPLSAPRRRHAFALDELTPGTGYDYQVLDAERAVVDAGRFRTASTEDAAPVRFAVVGDSGQLPWWSQVHDDPIFYAVACHDLLPPHGKPSTIGALMAEAEPHLWFHVGDVVYPSGEHRHYTAAFFRPFAELLRNAPCYPVLGNHDVRDDDGRQLLANFWLPTNDVTGDERFFSVAWGPVRFVGLDLGRTIEAGDPALEFLDRAFEGTSEPWRIALTHYPMYSASRHGDREDLIEHVLPLLQKHGVDLMFAGHEHNYERFGDPADGGMVLVISGGGGKYLYEIGEDERLQAKREDFHFCRVDVDGRNLTVEAIDWRGDRIEAFSMDLATQSEARGGRGSSTPRERRIEALLKGS